MDRASIPTSAADCMVLSEPHPGCLSPTDPEARGRRRRRDPAPVYTTLHRPQHIEASTLRGRARCRSLSCMNSMSLSASRATSPRRVRHHHHQETAATAVEDAKRRKILSVAFLRPENHRRSHSPSRSRSPVLEKNQKKKAAAHGMFSSSSSMAMRRRQRTQSRSRPHGQAGLFETEAFVDGPALRLELMAADPSARRQG